METSRARPADNGPPNRNTANTTTTAWRFAEQMRIQSSRSFGDYISAGTLRNVLRLGEMWQRAAALVKAISPCLPDLGTGPKIAPIPNAWGGFHEKALLDVSGLRRCDFALRRCANESAERRRRST